MVAKTTKKKSASKTVTARVRSEKTSKNVERSRLARLEAWLTKHKKVNLALWGISLAIWVGVVLICVEYILGLLVALLVPVEICYTNWFMTLFSAIVYALSLAIIIGIPWRFMKIKTTRDELGLRGLPTWTDLLLAPVGFLVVLVLIMVLRLFLPSVDWNQKQENIQFNDFQNIGNYLLAFFCLVVLAPIAEEIIFRGWFYGKLRARMAALPAILIVSVLFGVVHLQLNVALTVAAMSAVMCVSRELTGTIWTGILIHMINNDFAFYSLVATGGM